MRLARVADGRCEMPAISHGRLNAHGCQMATVGWPSEIAMSISPRLHVVNFQFSSLSLLECAAMGMGRTYAGGRSWKTPHVVVVRRSNFKVLREACQCLIGGVRQGLSGPLDTRFRPRDPSKASAPLPSYRASGTPLTCDLIPPSHSSGITTAC